MIVKRIEQMGTVFAIPERKVQQETPLIFNLGNTIKIALPQKLSGMILKRTPVII